MHVKFSTLFIFPNYMYSAVFCHFKESVHTVFFSIVEAVLPLKNNQEPKQPEILLGHQIYGAV